MAAEFTLEELETYISELQIAVHKVATSGKSITISNDAGSQTVTHHNLGSMRDHLEWLRNERKLLQGNTNAVRFVPYE